MTDERIFIFGGRSGIGLAVAKQAHQQAAHILIASRNATKFKLSEESMETCDVDITFCGRA